MVGLCNRRGCVHLVRACQNQSRSPPRPSLEPTFHSRSTCTSVPMCTRHVSNEAWPMTEIGTGKAEKKQSATAARASPAVECDLPDDPPPGACLGRRAAGTRRRLCRDDGAKAVYIDQPTIPVGMTVETYRRVRTRHKPPRLRRLRRSTSSAIRRAVSRLAHRRRTGDDPLPRRPSVSTISSCPLTSRTFSWKQRRRFWARREPDNRRGGARATRRCRAARS
jgi:hypothetical protein